MWANEFAQADTSIGCIWTGVDEGVVVGGACICATWAADGISSLFTIKESFGSSESYQFA